MQKKAWGTFFLIFLLVSFAVFIVITQILRVPLWWLFGFIVPLSTAQIPKLLVEVSPETPFSIGQMMTVTVTNSSSKLPVEDAQVTATKDGTSVTLYTDSQGQVSFEFFGEITVVVAHKTGIDSSSPVAIPKAPAQWVRDTLLSLVIAVVGGFVGGFTRHMLQKRETTRKTETGKSKRKRKT